MFATQITTKTPYHRMNKQPNEWTTTQMNDQDKLTTKTKEWAEKLNELTNELVAASLFDSNLFPRWFDRRVRINAKGKWGRKIIFYRAGFVLLLFFLFFLSFLFHLKFLDLCLSWLGRESGRKRRLISSPERPRPPCRPRPKAGRRKIPRPRP